MNTAVSIFVLAAVYVFQGGNILFTSVERFGIRALPQSAAVAELVDAQR
ncbi:hypothetical protein [Amylibacter sp. SFDW26]|nr:hypothetical protein [Amylibacter sp. SFDW26]